MNCRNYLHINSGKYTGKRGGGDHDLNAFHNMPFAKYEYINTWYKHYEMHREILGDAYRLFYPLAGNPVGMFHDNMIIPIEAIRHSFVSSQLLALVENIDNAVICEIGGGQGGQAYQTIKNAKKRLTYIILDIPEVLAMASYFLSSGCPDKKMLLYGEGDVSKDYDIILMPNFYLPMLEDQSVDLFFNQRSFPEMERETVMEYLSQICRICSKYLYHINYNNYAINEYGKGYVLATEVIPDPTIFKLVMQSPWYFNRLVEEIRLTYMAFLYERRNQIKI